ncbi:MAG: hypothetical protein IJV77_05535 [Clostridia bacterium]|nr:hypothetical protein [Clostridia bacterium]
MQDFRRGAHNFFSKGVSVNQVFNASLKDSAIRHTAKKLSSHLRYIQKEYEVQLLNDDKRKHKYAKQKTKQKAKGGTTAGMIILQVFPALHKLTCLQSYQDLFKKSAQKNVMIQK